MNLNLIQIKQAELEEQLISEIAQLVQLYLPASNMTGNSTFKVDGKPIDRESFLKENLHIFIQRIAFIGIVYNALYKQNIRQINFSVEVPAISSVISTSINTISKLKGISACDVVRLLRADIGYKIALWYGSLSVENPLYMGESVTYTQVFDKYYNQTLANFVKLNKTKLTTVIIERIKTAIEKTHMPTKVPAILVVLNKYNIFNTIFKNENFSILAPKGKPLPHLEPIKYNYLDYIRSGRTINLDQNLFMTAAVITHGSVTYLSLIHI